MGDYVSESDVPVIGPDPYDSNEKQKAIKYAESKLEADVNEGSPLENHEEIHEFAANAYASYILATGPEDPADAYSGDFSDGGEDVSEFAQNLHNMYRSARSSILAADEDEGEGTSPIQLGGSRHD